MPPISTLVHIAEIAALMLVAYQLGWFLGYIPRRILRRPAPVAAGAGASSDAPASAKREAEPPVRAPVIAPVARPPSPSVAPVPPVEDAPTAALSEAFLDQLQSAMLEPSAPAEPRAGYAAASAAAAAALEAALELTPPEPLPEPTAREESTPVPPAALAPAVEAAVAPVEIAKLGDDAATFFELEVELGDDVLEPQEQPAGLGLARAPVVEALSAEPAAVAAPQTLAPAAPPAAEARPASRPGEVWSGRPIPPPRPTKPEPPPALAVPTPPPPAKAAPQPAPPRVEEAQPYEMEASDEDAEAAAMRAIEGGWTRKQTIRQPARDLPEGTPPCKRDS
ncbi:MAG: hypothetical protein ABL866_00200 [Devosia sp.]